jgi:hypothetical protein
MKKWKKNSLSEQFHNPIDKIVDSGKIDTPTHMHDSSLSWLGTERLS